MSLPNTFSRFNYYLKRHGIRATVSRGALSFSRLFTKQKSFIFYLDLPAMGSWRMALPDHTVVIRKNQFSSIDKIDLQKIMDISVPETARKNMVERFDAGANLWLLKSNGILAAYGWTLVGKTVEPYFYPLGSNDAHLFDFYVFSEFRGKRYNQVLLSTILAELHLEKRNKAFIDTYEWNTSQLHSLAHTSFVKLGVARKIKLFNSLIVVWGKWHFVNHNK